MNEYEGQCRRAESVKQRYSPGTRIELIFMNDPFAPVPSETRGTVRTVDDMGTIFPELRPLCTCSTSRTIINSY